MVKISRISIVIVFCMIFTPSTASISQANNVTKTSVTVFAASSLLDSYTELGSAFERANPKIKINWVFQGSSTLAAQIKSGAPADIFVSAEPISGGENYLKNRVVLAVPIGSKIKKIKDLDLGAKWVMCASEVPCGKVALLALRSEKIKSKPVSYEPRVSSAAAKLLAGEVDAAILYNSDVVTNKSKLRAIEFRDQTATYTTYQIIQLNKNLSTNQVMRFLKSDSTLKLLQSRGFGRL